MTAVSSDESTDTNFDRSAVARMLSCTNSISLHAPWRGQAVGDRRTQTLPTRHAAVRRCDAVWAKLTLVKTRRLGP